MSSVSLTKQSSIFLNKIMEFVKLILKQSSAYSKALNKFRSHFFILSYTLNEFWGLCRITKTRAEHRKKFHVLGPDLSDHYLNFLLQDPVQEWGEEEEDGAVFGITLRREPVPTLTMGELPMSFVQYHTVKVRRLKAATLERLVTHLLDPEKRESDFIQVFLSTYRAFTSTSTLIELLFQRWDFVDLC